MGGNRPPDRLPPPQQKNGEQISELEGGKPDPRPSKKQNGGGGGGEMQNTLHYI